MPRRVSVSAAAYCESLMVSKAARRVREFVRGCERETTRETYKTGEKRRSCQRAVVGRARRARSLTNILIAGGQDSPAFALLRDAALGVFGRRPSSRTATARESYNIPELSSRQKPSTFVMTCNVEALGNHRISLMIPSNRALTGFVITMSAPDQQAGQP